MTSIVGSSKLTGDPVTEQLRRRAQAQARAICVQTARAGTVVTYGQLVEGIDALSYTPNHPALTDLLCAISRKENHAGRGMLSSVVVRVDTGQPGEGFFTLATELGREYENEGAFWKQECAKVYRAWSA